MINLSSSSYIPTFTRLFFQFQQYPSAFCVLATEQFFVIPVDKIVGILTLMTDCQSNCLAKILFIPRINNQPKNVIETQTLFFERYYISCFLGCEFHHLYYPKVNLVRSATFTTI